MSDLVVFGFGYSARYYLEADRAQWREVVVTVRDEARATALNAQAGAGVRAIAFDGSELSAELAAAVERADAVLVSVPPGDAGDPVLARCGDMLVSAGRVRDIVYLSTLGVYGDHDGDWVDESSDCRATEGRSLRRVEAERGWSALGSRLGACVSILRLAGIYGPGRSAFETLRSGNARVVDKPGQVFNRVHVEDIAQAIKAAFERRVGGIFNVVDDLPSPPGDPILFAAESLGIEPPPVVPFELARQSMSPMALSFYSACRRVRNDRLKALLEVQLRYPNYRDGLAAILRHS